MIYVALLRGINVGGKNKVDMKALKEMFETLGLERITTYINTGNIVFSSSGRGKPELVATIHRGIQKNFQMEVPVQIRTLDEFDTMMKKMPESWQNDQTMKCDVLFLEDEIDDESILTNLKIKQGIDTVYYVPGALLWSIDRKDVTKSGLMKIVGTKIYQKMTIRNVNTARKLHELMKTTANGT